jgi:hypothetical protein
MWLWAPRLSEAGPLFALIDSTVLSTNSCGKDLSSPNLPTHRPYPEYSPPSVCSFADNSLLSQPKTPLGRPNQHRTNNTSSSTRSRTPSKIIATGVLSLNKQLIIQNPPKTLIIIISTPPSLLLYPINHTKPSFPALDASFFLSHPPVLILPFLIPSFLLHQFINPLKDSELRYPRHFSK